MKYLLLIAFIGFDSTSYAGSGVNFPGLKMKVTKILSESHSDHYAHFYYRISFRELDKQSVIVEVQTGPPGKGYSQKKLDRSQLEYSKNTYFENCESVHEGEYEFIDLPIGRHLACRTSIRGSGEELRLWKIPGVAVSVKEEYYRNGKLSYTEEAIEILE